MLREVSKSKGFEMFNFGERFLGECLAKIKIDPKLEIDSLQQFGLD
jgi:hypothetical protein